MAVSDDSLATRGVTVDALEFEALSPVFGMLNAAGPVGWLLASMCLLALTIFLYKILVFWRSGLWQRRQLAAAKPRLANGDIEGMLALLEGMRHPAGQLVRLAVERSRMPGLSLQALQAEMEQLSLNALDRLKSGLKLIAAIAALSPLLGLLGTVLGMIEAFRQMEAAGSQIDPSILSGGIWLALLTTAIGLIVAIPATVAHLWLNATVARAGRQLEAAGTAILSALGIERALRDHRADTQAAYSVAAE